MNVAELLRLFRDRRDADKTLHDLEAWMKGKLAIIRRQAKRVPSDDNLAKAAVWAASLAEVTGERFMVLARRAAMPRMSVFA